MRSALVLLFVGSVAGLSPRSQVQVQRKHFQKQAAFTSVEEDGSNDYHEPHTHWLTQRLNHFAPNPATYQQRYLVNASFFDGSGPVFLCVGGEGPGFTPDVVVTGTEHAADMIEAARQHGALILALEHRYYGESIPTSDLSTENLRWLSSAQALADLAAFVGHINKQYKLSPAKNKWVTWGGSYPGMMASFARLKFPSLIHAAVASSAPVQAVLNMQGYLDVSASSLAATSVGGSEGCVSSVRSAFDALGERLLGSATDLKALQAQFNVCPAKSGANPLEDPLNQATFAEDLSFAFPIQSNEPGCTGRGCNIASICANFMTNASIGDTISRLAAFNALLNQQAGEPCTSVSYTESVASLTNVTKAGGGGRVWQYQTCTEFGFYQTCDPGTGCPFTSKPHGNSLSSSLAQCQLAFGRAFTEEYVASSVEFSNLWDGGDSPGSSRVLFANGEIDPWHSQSVLPSNKAFGKLIPFGAEGSELYALMVEGASHHYWTHADGVQSAPIVRARQLIFGLVAKWLKQP